MLNDFFVYTRRIRNRTWVRRGEDICFHIKSKYQEQNSLCVINVSNLCNNNDDNDNNNLILIILIMII